MEAELDRLLKDLSGYSEEQLMQSPTPEAWSVIQVMQHLIAAEEGSMAYVKKKSSYPDNFKKANWLNGLRILALKFFLNAPFKFKAPEVVNESKFDPEVDFEDLVEKWREVRHKMMDFLDNVPDEYLDILLYRHAFAGRLTLEGMLVFFHGHFARHRKQIDRTLKAVSGS